MDSIECSEASNTLTEEGAIELVRSPEVKQLVHASVHLGTALLERQLVGRISLRGRARAHT